jgi:ribosomal protein S18 acetylase RimI-like enzyme
MEIVKAQINDLAEILNLQKLCYHENAIRYNDFSLDPLTQTLSDVNEEFAKKIVLKAVEGGKIIGSIRAFDKDGTCHIGRVIVHPDYQNRGIGKLLMGKIESFFKISDRFELHTGFRDVKNLFFYTKLGYNKFKEQKATENLTMVFFEKQNIQCR